jgi:hypothetical protein
MKYLKLGIIILAIGLSGCTGNKEKGSKAGADTSQSTASRADTTQKPASAISGDKEQIRDLIRKAIAWAEGDTSINILPILMDSKDSIGIGFDLKKLGVTLTKLKASGFFLAEFIENYRQIILTLDKKIKNKEVEYTSGELPNFGFANDVDPWTLCQDVPYDKPNPYTLLEVKVVSLDNNAGELVWTWGNPDKTKPLDWKGLSYKFKVKKEDGKWKIAYMQGFDYKIGVSKDGE